MIKAASLCFDGIPKAGSELENHAGFAVEEVLGPLTTTVTLLEDGPQRLCLVTSGFTVESRRLNHAIRATAAEGLGIPFSNVLVFGTHNHSAPTIERDARSDAMSQSDPSPADRKPDLLPLGKAFMRDFRRTVKKLRPLLQPVTVWWSLGREGRITYHRKGWRADGTTYFMREEDRKLVARDYRGDIDEDAPVVCLRGEDGRPVCFLTQFTGHPVTSYHPERPVVFGEYCQVATDLLASHHARNGETPVGFLQGFAGDTNTKEMFEGGIERAQQFGKYLGETYVKAARKLKQSERNSLDFVADKVAVPLAPLPARRTLEKEIRAIKAFIKRARAGDEDTVSLLGMNYPRGLSPTYRAAMAEHILPWSEWALNLWETGQEQTVPKTLEMDIYVLRLGDVGIVGVPAEPFWVIGRTIKENSPLPLTIPCGYANGCQGYISDSRGTNDREYMSAFYRCTRFRPPFRKPSGDVIAREAVRILKGLAKIQPPRKES